MVVLDTSVVIDLIKRKEDIIENVTGVTFIEYPAIVKYKKFSGNILFPTFDEYILAHNLQNLLLRAGKPKTFADLLIASICINNDEELITKDKDFSEIAENSELKLRMAEE